MKRFFKVSLLTAACALALPSQGLELGIYGQGHLSLDNVDNGVESSLHTASSSSRLGFKGFHQLDDSLKVIFQYETGVDLTAQGANDGNGEGQSSGQIFTKGRPSFVGLEGDFGTVLIGHMPYLDQWANDYNLFADQVGDLGNLWEASGIPGRADNVLYYKTRTFSGFDLAATYVPEEGVDDSQKTLIKGSYRTKQLQLNLAYNSLGQGAMINDNHKSLAFTAAYDFGHFSLGGGYQSQSDIGGMANADRDSFYLGGSINVGDKGKFKAQYAVSESDSQQADATQFAIGYDYAYDKQTTLYVAYASMDNDANVQFSANGKGHGDKVIPEFGNDPSALSLGIIYHFDYDLIK